VTSTAGTDGGAGAVALSGDMVAVVVCRGGRAPAGADEAVAEAGGRAVLVGEDPEQAWPGLPSATDVWWAVTGSGPARLASQLAGPLAAVRLIVLPASPDGRDLAPRLAARMGRPLLAGAARCGVEAGRPVADLLRVDGQVVVPAASTRPAVATLWPGARGPQAAGGSPRVSRIDLAEPPGGAAGARDPEVTALIEPDPATMDLSEARRVVGGGAGLVPTGSSPQAARTWFALMVDVAAALGASAGATRVVTDAGWMGYERQIGTTGVAIDPDLYLALGVSGASQHVGGLGTPATTVSVNLDPSCPMTAMSDLGVVTDAPALLVELARRLGVPVPAGLADRGGPVDPTAGAAKGAS
jgi:electron transfer flavoprotein alpha subunit